MVEGRVMGSLFGLLIHRRCEQSERHDATAYIIAGTPPAVLLFRCFLFRLCNWFSQVCLL